MFANNGLSGIGNDIASIFGGMNYQNPADKAMPYLQQIMQMLPQYFTPFIQAGTSALPNLQNQYNRLTNNPGDFIKQIGAGYQESPGFEFALKQGTNAANQAAAAGGMAGTPQAQQNASQIATNLANKDFYNYLSNVLGQYDIGLSGQQGMANQGQQASSALGSDLGSVLAQMAAMQYLGQQNQNQSQSSIGSGIGGLISKGLSLFGL